MFVGRSKGPEIRHGEAHILVHTLSAQTADCRSTDAIRPLYTRLRYVHNEYLRKGHLVKGHQGAELLFMYISLRLTTLDDLA